MKKLLVLLLSTIMIISCCGCIEEEDPATADAERSQQFSETYDFYDESIDELEEKMALNTLQANSVFQILVDVGVDEEINHCFEKDGYFDVWAGGKKMEVYMVDGSVEKIIEDEFEIYTGAEPNTQEKIDEIYTRAEHDAKHMTSKKIDKTLDDAFVYLKEHCDNFYESNEVMEKALYYSAFVRYYIHDNIDFSAISELEESTQIFYNACLYSDMAITLVYEKITTSDDTEVIDALTKAKENLDKIKVE